MSVAVVTSDGPIYDGFWGLLRANETEDENQRAVDRHTIYRLASISKLTTVLETYILRDRGALNLDDPVKKFLPQLSYTPEDDPLTFRQLMSHMSGLGRDWPPGDSSKAWPKSLDGAGPPHYNGLPFPSHEQFFDAIAHNQLIVPPYTYPIYSNTGFSLLGLANVAASRAFEGGDSPQTHAELLQRDIFDPLGLNGSSFLLTEINQPHVAVASMVTVEADQDFGDATNPAGGQYGSLSDLTKLMQTFLNPSGPKSLISSYTMREWVRPIHVWFDDFSEVGALWEIYKSHDSYGRSQKIYQKFGNLAGYHSAFTMNPVNSYGIVVLTTGPTVGIIPLINIIIENLQPAFGLALENATRDLLVGTWLSDDGQGTVTIVLEEGSLFVTQFLLNGTNVLSVMHQGKHPTKVPLWSSGEDEFKLAISPEADGCLFSWVGLDGFGYIDGYSVNSLRVTRTGNDTILHLPATGTELKRPYQSYPSR
ncbi:hypothetical protein SERLA73DRAFT_96244 [Serpula lacrymans var. lacrymans S7.3]|uniref:Beta-lactamase-related domain-containing protein n=2 Tax=Serpula lacrymans var. lacrymans TaxID=341189 RepID=F8Q9X1_SERL3|nr:uncharacterized protein SERLADRAFT_358214 [Serpula lacrymans var. lacrymans S7.9]EGN94876.1 hypothetical protein SERLA73DRAFT_96244 [Serpula lacrymans var. lacrymans S7.3]EGO20369.1 hypothetical protein SERLADRAFT_358214 [Serpula lacrymans var. lacrymans S7.9]